MSERPEVLVVDDDSEFLEYLRTGLNSAVPTVARTPLEAMWMLEHRTFRAVVCDLVLGNVDGRSLLDVVYERWPATARILITGFGARLEHCTMGDLLPAVQAVLIKPCDVAALDELLADLREYGRSVRIPVVPAASSTVR